MAVTRTFPNPVEMQVLGREAAELGLDSAITTDDGLTVTFLDTDDEALVDQVVAAYNAAMAERQAIIDALQANTDYINLPSRTTAQVAAQVLALTRQMNGLVRLLNRRGVLD